MYGKVYSKIVTSSIWSESAEVCKVWVTLIVLADADGFVGGSVIGLARVCALPVEAVAAALEKFKAPDPFSSDLSEHPENEGRRLAEADGGWKLLNFTHYQKLKDADEQRFKEREKKRKQRAGGATSGTVPKLGDTRGLSPGQGDKRGQIPPSPFPSPLTLPSSLSPVPPPPVDGVPSTAPTGGVIDVTGEGFRLTPPDPAGNGKRPRPGIVTRTPAEFEDFWAGYPRGRRVGKGDALRAWLKLTQVEQAQALKAEVEFARIWSLADPDRTRFCPHPSTWLNQHRWDDSPDAWRVMVAGDQPGALADLRRREGRGSQAAGLPEDIVALIASKRESRGN